MRKLIQTFKDFPELIGLPISLLGFYIYPLFVRLIDPTIAEIDLGIFHFVILAVNCVLLFNALVFLGIKFNFPNLYQWYVSYKSSPEDLSFWHFFAVFAVLSLQFALVLVAIV